LFAQSPGGPDLDRRISFALAADATRFLDHPPNRLDELRLWASVGTVQAAHGKRQDKAAEAVPPSRMQASTLGRGMRVGARPPRNARRRIQDSASAQMPLFAAAPASAQVSLF